MPSIKSAKKLDNLPAKIKSFFENDDKGSLFLQQYFLSLFAYVSKRLPEISDQFYSIDDALKSGYAWDIGPFEYWDIIGIEKGIKLAEEQGESIAPWVKDMVSSGFTKFYKSEHGKQYYFNIEKQSYEILPGSEKNI